MLEITPMTLKEANAYVEQNHRHHGPVVGHKFSIGCSDWRVKTGPASGQLAGSAWDKLAASGGPESAGQRLTCTRRK